MATLTEPDPRGPDPTRPIRVRQPWQVMAFIEQARIHARMTQRKLAHLAGTSQPTYVGWANTGSVRGHHNSHAHMPRLSNVLALLDALGLDMVIRPAAPAPTDVAEIPTAPMCGVRHFEPCQACQSEVCCEHCFGQAA